MDKQKKQLNLLIIYILSKIRRVLLEENFLLSINSEIGKRQDMGIILLA